MSVDVPFWRNKRVLVTGHTGFKGSWLSLWLHWLGAKTTGYALPPPTTPSLFVETRVADTLDSHFGDICNYNSVIKLMKKADPEIIFHLAAQPLVRESYAQPLETYSTNVMGAAHVLEAARHLTHLRAIIVVTTDKCYENLEVGRPFSETDPLGGADPYSASKACAEIVAASYRESFFASSELVGLATVRAGNVIGGGDFANDRIVPDIIRAWQDGTEVSLRNPHAVRPWQDVLEPIGGYLLLAEKLWTSPKKYSEAYNFGPPSDDCREVGELADMLCNKLKTNWHRDLSIQPKEAGYLRLNSEKAVKMLGWRQVFTFDETIDSIAKFAEAMRSNQDLRFLCMERIDEYERRQKV